MELVSKMEFRGVTSTLSKDKTKSYNFINLEDVHGESAKFLADLTHDYPKFEKGKTYTFTFDYSPRYGSIKIVGVQ